jgi:1-acyl-sn-glycerol-3-phosphate acyltransferase
VEAQGKRPGRHRRSVAVPASKRPAKAAVTKKAAPQKAAKKAAARRPKKAAKPKDHLDEGVIAKLLPVLRALRGYTRLKVDGLENVPKKGPAILAANHTGWLGLDYALTALVLHDEADRTPRGMAHTAWFSNPVTARFAGQVGLSRVSKEAMAEQLARGHLVMVFPEGEKGAFRAASGYEVLEFARGFVRVAMAQRVPIVPVAVLGGEESNPVDRTLKGYEEMLKLQLPVPRNILPKPVKWRIRFLPALEFADAHPTDADDSELAHATSEVVRARIQKALRQLEADRGHPYL